MHSIINISSAPEMKAAGSLRLPTTAVAAAPQPAVGVPGHRYRH